MSRITNTPLKTVFIAGRKLQQCEDCIVIKPDIDLEVEADDIFAIMFYRNPDINEGQIMARLTSQSSGLPLDQIFEQNNPLFPYPLNSNGEVVLSDRKFVMLKVRSQLDTTQSIILDACWVEVDGEVFYPPEMEIKVKPPGLL